MSKQLISKNDTVEVYLDGGKIVKIFSPDSPKSKALYEALTAVRVEECGILVPEIYEVSVNKGRWSITMEYIEGKTLAQMMEEDPQNIDKYLEQFVDIHTSIHKKQMPKLTKIKDKLSRQISSLDIDDSKKYELLGRLEEMPKHSQLVHGNFTPRKIIFNEKGTYIIDWLAAKQGNPSADAGRTYLLLSINNPELAEKYLDLFCAKTGIEKRHVQEWLPIVAAAQLVHNRPNERELLMKWCDVASYE